ncbi:MAG: PD-(D/E)XK nuclease family protein [Gemmatimonadota bacterium]
MPERTFLGWDAPALPAAVAHLADRYADANAGALTLRDCVLAVPGKRAGRRVKELLVAEAERRGLRLVPPRVTTPGSLPELLRPPARPVASGALCRRVWADTLRALRPEQAVRLFAEAPAGEDLRGWVALGRQLETLHREVAAGGLTFQDVAERCGGELLFDDSPRWLLLADLQAAYAEALERLGFTDRYLARVAALDAAEAAEAADGPEVWLLGVAELPVVVRRLLAALPAGRLHALIHAPADMADAFDELGCVIPAFWTDYPVPVEDGQLLVVEGPADQAAATAGLLARLEGAYSADEIAVGAPDAEVVPYLAERLAEAGVPARHAEGLPVRATAPYRFLEAVAEVLEGGSAEAWAALARHPDLWRWLRTAGAGFDHAGATALRSPDAWLEPLDSYLARHLPARLGRSLPGGADARGRAGVGALVQAVGGLTRALRGSKPVREWMPLLMELLLDVYGTQRLNRHVHEDRVLLAACTKLRDAAGELAAVATAADQACAPAVAIRILLDDAAGEAIAPEPEEAAVEILGWLEMHLDDAPVAILTGVNEPYLPASLNADPFLPDALRAALGLEDNARRQARDAYQLSAILHTRAHAGVIVGRRSAAGDPLRPSRLALAATGAPLAERVRAFFGHEAPVSGWAAAAGGAGAEGDATPVSAFRLPPDPELRAAEPIDRLAVTAFRGLLQDPYMFALERVLGLHTLDDDAREMDGLVFGDFAHKVLERFGRSDLTSQTDVGVLAAGLDGILDTLAEARFGNGARPAVRLQLAQLRARLHAFAKWQAEHAAAGWRIVGVECATEDEGVPFEVDGAPVHLTGRVDRIDYHAEEEAWMVLDYKTGDRAHTPEDTHRRGRSGAREWVDLQLPLYRHILPAVCVDANNRLVTPKIDHVMFGYLTLCAEADHVGACFAEWSAAELAEADEAARGCVRMLRRNVFAWEPGARAYAHADVKALLGEGRLLSPEDEVDGADELDVLGGAR